MPADPELLARYGGRLPEHLRGEQTPPDMFLRIRAVRMAAGKSRLAGTGTTLTILWEWPDHPADQVAHPASVYEDLLYSVGTYPTGSLNDYFRENSSGMFDVAGGIIGWTTAVNSYNSYGMPGGGYDAYHMLIDAIGELDATVDFSQYDNDGPDGLPDSGDDDGIVDALFFIHAGPGQESTGDPNDIWSHAYYFDPPLATADGVSIVNYSFDPEEQPDGAVIGIGALCHEYGHVLGLPDLYDNDYTSGGIGEWGLMGSGGYNHREGDGTGTCPAHLSAWCKKELGWVTVVPIVNSTTGVLVGPVVTVPQVYQFWRPGGSGGQEYFLCENRRQIGFDEGLVRRQIRLGLPAPEGLLIYHVDESAITNVMDHRRLVDVEEASPWFASPDSSYETLDGDRRVSTYHNLSQPNRGDDGDLWPGFTAYSADSTTWLEPRDRTRFGPETRPSSQDNDCLDTGLAIEIADVIDDDILVDFLIEDAGRSGATLLPTTLIWDFEEGIQGLSPCGQPPIWDQAQGLGCLGNGGLWFGRIFADSPCPSQAGYGNGWAGFVSKRIVVDAHANPSVTIRHRYQLESGYDFAHVEFRCAGDLDQPWHSLATFTSYRPCGSEFLWLASGALDDCADEDGMAEIHLRFRFESDWSGSTDDGTYCGLGWWIDEIQVTGASLGVEEDPKPGNVEDAGQTPGVVLLEGAKPNPFNPATSLRYFLPAAVHQAQLEVYDQRGRRVRVLSSGPAAAGWHAADWEGRDDAGRAVPSGVYFVRLGTERRVTTQKLVLLR
jgi:M6 family metalloprotease-like protein